MKKIRILFYFVIGMIANFAAFGQNVALPPELGPHTWTATVNVTDENGDPVVGANVTISYTVPPLPGRNFEAGPDRGEIKGLTDATGVFIGSHTDSSEGVGIVVGKTGFYTTQAGYQFFFDEKRKKPVFKLGLKKVGKPIAMYAKIFYGTPPVLEKPVGYDLEVGDWIAPYGKGLNADVIFTKVSYRKSGSDYDYKVIVDFPNNGDGILKFVEAEGEAGSYLLSPHEAPANGYQNQLIKDRYARPGVPPKSNYDSKSNYFIRVRTKLDSQGNVQSALYGKIYGDFMQFRYYLNPTPNDRNIEFDPKQNLLGGLNPLEEVSAP